MPYITQNEISLFRNDTQYTGSFSMLANPVALLAAVCTADTFYNFGAEKPLER